MESGANGLTILQIFERFVAAINEHDIEALDARMTADHLFVDSLGNRMQGASMIKEGWRGYFALCPDYWIRIDTMLEGGEMVLAAGEAGGTIDGITWKTPAALQAKVYEAQVAEWRVFADNKPVYEILTRRTRS